MRRTTICRSKASVALALTLLGAASLRAQQAPAPQQPPAAEQQPQQQQSVPPASLPATHLVQNGETLWSLAQQYFGDPLLWPEIYRINTDIVEDPHWIFPGEELRLTAPVAVTQEPATPTVVAVTPQPDTTQAAPAQPVPTRPTAPTIFSTIGRQQSGLDAGLEVGAARLHPVVSEDAYYSAPWLTEGEAIAGGRVLGNVQSSVVGRLGTATSAQQFTVVAIAPPDDTLRAGDLLVSVRRARALRGYGDIMVPTALLQVTDSAAQRPAARVMRIYSAVTDGQEVLRVTPYWADTTQPVAVAEGGLDAEVIGMLLPGEIVQISDRVFLNKGADDGVRIGDSFQLSSTDRRATMGGAQLVQAEALIVNVRPHSATAVITRVLRPDVRIGSTARQIRRMPS